MESHDYTPEFRAYSHNLTLIPARYGGTSIGFGNDGFRSYISIKRTTRPDLVSDNRKPTWNEAKTETLWRYIDCDSPFYVKDITIPDFVGPHCREEERYEEDEEVAENSVQ